MSRDTSLPGRMSEVTRLGGTVRRSIRGQGAQVPQYLCRLRAAGFTGAPRWLGLDQHGNGVFDFVAGEVPRTAADVPDAALPSVGVLLRQLHAASHSIVAETVGVRPDLVLCHNDLAPRNTVFRRGRALAYHPGFADWATLLTTIERRVRFTRDGILAKADAGEPAHQALVDEGVPAGLDTLLAQLRTERAPLLDWLG